MASDTNEKMHITLHYGPGRAEGLAGRGKPYDHPFSRLMPDEVTAKIDEWVEQDDYLEVVLVEELPFTYLRYLIRRGTLTSTQVRVFWWDEGERELRIGEHGELLDPWPTGFFDRSLEFILKGWGNE